MKDLPLNMLRAFAAVYETGGVRPAARALGITHSSISRHIHELEAWIEAPLFERREGRRMLAFTAQGEALGKAALASLMELASAVAAVREARRANAVTIETTPSFAARWLLPRLALFEETHKWIEVSLLVDQRARTAGETGADIGIRMGRKPGDATTSIPLMDDTLYPVMSADYWAAAGKPDKISDLDGLRLIHDRDPNASWDSWKKQHGPKTLNVRSGARFTSSDLVLRAAEQGLGVALARGRLAEESVAAKSLVAPFEGLCVHLPQAHWIVVWETAPLRVATRAVIDWLISQASAKAWFLPDSRINH